MANNTNTKRIEKLEADMVNLNSKIDQLIALMSNNNASYGSTRGASTSSEFAKMSKANRDAKREAEKADFKATHKLIRSSKENKELVYAEMKKQGITEFNRKDYERIAKGLGVLGKSGKVVATWEEIK